LREVGLAVVVEDDKLAVEDGAHGHVRKGEDVKAAQLA
jgi:hypothetical protein